MTGSDRFTPDRPFVVALLLLAVALAPAARAQETPPAVLAERLRTLVGFGGVDTFSIMEIQGPDAFSPIKDQLVTTSGVVTLSTADGTGFWIQDPAGDGDPRTSDGIFVLLGRQPQVTARPRVRDLVRLVGSVAEHQPGTSLPHTRLQNLLRLEILERGRPLPAPVPITVLPDLEIEEAVAFWEPLEGMRVSLAAARVVAPTNRDGQAIVLAPANTAAASGYHPARGLLLLRSLGGHRVDYNPERIVIDDDASQEKVELWMGDELEDLVGVVDYGDRTYRIQAASLRVARQGPRLPAGPASEREGPRGNLRITDWNLGILFDTEDDPGTFDENYDPIGYRYGVPPAEEVERRIHKIALAVIQELELPDIIVTQEVETEELLQRIGDQVNARAGTRYRAVSPPTSDLRGLDPGFLFDEARVTLLEHHQLAGPEVEAVFGLSSPFRCREPLVGVFRPTAGGPPLTIVANHFKTKRNDGVIPTINPSPIRVTERQRKNQARVVRSFVDGLLRDDPEALVVVAGDFADFQFPEPGEGEHALGILEGGPGEVRLRNLIELEEEADRYSWLFYGQGHVLSHVLASPALARLAVAADFLHFNSRFPERLASDPSTAIRASDRDALETRFELPTSSIGPKPPSPSGADQR